MLTINVATFEAQVAAALKKVEATCLHAYRDLVSGVYSYIVHETPQYTGGTVGNWRLSINGQTGREPTYLPLGGRVYSKQNPNLSRVAEALTQGETGLSQLKSLTDKVFIFNRTEWLRADLDVGGSVAWIETNPSYFRQENQPARVITRGVSYVVSRPLLKTRGV